MFVPVGSALLSHVEPALTRLRYIHPSIAFAATPSGIEVSAETAFDAEVLTKDVNYALYRERIYAETLPLRRSLIEAVTRR